MPKQDRQLLILLVGLTLIRGLIYISIVPPWLAPDEPAHFEAIRLIGQEDLWPTFEIYVSTPMHQQMHGSFRDFRIWQLSRLPPPQSPLDSEQPISEFFVLYYPPTSTGHLVIAGDYPLIYHRLMAFIATALQQFDLVAQLYAMRVVSLLLTALTVITGWFFAKTIFPTHQAVAVGLTSFLIFLPMNMHVNTSVNNDSLAMLLASLYFLALATIFCRGVSALRLATILVVLVVAVLVKPTNLFLLPTTCVAFMLFSARYFNWKAYWLAISLFVIMVLAIAGSIILFHLSNGGRTLLTFDSVTEVIRPGTNYFDDTALAIYLHSIRFFFLSIWGLFGWANIPVLGAGIRVLWAISLIIGGGLVIFLSRYFFREADNNALRSSQRGILAVLLLAVALALISVFTPTVATQSVTWGPPSRYFFPALLPVSLFSFLGFQQLIPTRLSNLTLSLWLGALITFDGLALTVLTTYLYS